MPYLSTKAGININLYILAIYIYYVIYVRKYINTYICSYWKILIIVNFLSNYNVYLLLIAVHSLKCVHMYTCTYVSTVIDTKCYE